MSNPPTSANDGQQDHISNSAAGIRPEDCPEPGWHETHRYCPVCTWHEEPCAQELRLFQGELGVVECVLPPGHAGKHETKVRWL